MFFRHRFTFLSSSPTKGNDFYFPQLLKEENLGGESVDDLKKIGNGEETLKKRSYETHRTFLFVYKSGPHQGDLFIQVHPYP